jgi:hypothetical protein
VTSEEPPRVPADDEEVVDALPVHLDAPVPTARPSRGALAQPVVAQAAALAVGGFAAGAATVAVVRRRRTRKAVKRRRKELGSVLASRSFLVDVHLLSGRD